VNLFLKTVIAMAAPWPKVIGEVNLNLGMVEDGMALRIGSSWALRREGLSRCRIQANRRPLWRCGRCLADQPGPGTSDSSKKMHRDLLLNSRSVPPGRPPLSLAAKIGSYALAQENCLRQGHSYPQMATADGEAAESPCRPLR